MFDAFSAQSLLFEDLLPADRGGPVRPDYVMQGGTCAQFLDKLYDMMDFLLPNYINEGKNQLVVEVGCTEASTARDGCQGPLPT